MFYQFFAWMCGNIKTGYTWVQLYMYHNNLNSVHVIWQQTTYLTSVIQTFNATYRVFPLRYQCTPNDNLAQPLLHGHAFQKTPNKVYILWKLNNCRFRLLLDIRQKIKPFPKIAIIPQKYMVSQNRVRFRSELNGRKRATSLRFLHTLI